MWGDLSAWAKDKQLDLLVESYASSVFIVEIRGATPSSYINAVHTTTNDRVLATSVIQLGDEPISLTARTQETSVSPGQCYVRVSLRVEGVVIATLLAGYVTDTRRPSWPNGQLQSSVEGPGFLRSITGTDPAAGAEISETVPTGARWRLISLRSVLVTDANAANRRPTVTLDDGTNIYFASGGATDITATSTIPISFVQNFGPATSAGGRHILPLPDTLLLPAGHRIITVTSNIQVGDNWGAPQMLVEEWLEP